MNKGDKLFEGKAKIIYETKDKNLVIQHFIDNCVATGLDQVLVVESWQLT